MACVCAGMQDFNYLHTNCFEVTVELGCDKFPAEEDLFTSWHENHEALITFMETVRKHGGASSRLVFSLSVVDFFFAPQAHRGIKGIVKDENGLGIKDARISVKGVRHDITTGRRHTRWMDL